MKNNKKELIMHGIIIFSLLIVIIGASFAYFTSNVDTINADNNVLKGNVSSLVDVVMDYGDKIEAENILPGYKVIKTIQIKGKGEENSVPISISMELTPYVADFKNHIKYTIYEVENNNIRVEDLCTVSHQTNLAGQYYDSMTCDTSSLGEEIKSGIFEDKKKIVTNTLVEYNTNKTYYILVEYLNDTKPQDEEQGKSFSINIGYSEQKENTLVDYIISRSQNNPSIKKIQHLTTVQTKEQKDYRYVRADPNNYIYFGCEENCETKDLYRIIGIIPTQNSETSEYVDRIKLIKATNWEGKTIESPTKNTPSGKGYRWNSGGVNKWEESSLQQILNTEFYNSLTEYQKYIEPVKWYLGALERDSATNYKTEDFYNMERSNVACKSGGLTSFIANIGLIYLSDYGYSLDGGENNKIYTTETLYEKQNSYITNAWLYNLQGGNYSEWTINPESSYTNAYGPAAWIIAYVGRHALAGISHSDNLYSIRPSFYLKENVLYKSGDGSIDNPYKIS